MTDQTTAPRYRVLVIEDHEDSAQWLRVLLTQHGYDVAVAHDGTEGRKQREQWTPDLVLLDVRLPDTDGVELFRALRQAQPDLEAIVMTGHGSVPGAVKAIQAGALNYVEKPIDPSVLLALLEKAGERIALSAENRRLRRQLGDAQTAFGEMLSASPQERGPDRRERAADGRERYGQGAGGERDPRKQPAGGWSAAQDQLRGDSVGAD
jgi:DNA-binding NtrC family response regulator